jgi:hypothetical protein
MRGKAVPGIVWRSVNVALVASPLALVYRLGGIIPFAI